MFEFLKPKPLQTNYYTMTKKGLTEVNPPKRQGAPIAFNPQPEYSQPPLKAVYPTITEEDVKRYSIFKEPEPKETGPFKVRIHGETEEEQADFIFRKIYGFKDLTFNIFMGLTHPEAWACMLLGPPATAKSLIALTVAEHFKDVLYINTKSSSAGLIRLLQNHPNTKIIIVEEWDRWNSNDINDLRSLLSDGRIDKELADETIHISMPGLKVLITSNGVEKFDVPIMSRFVEYYIPEYTDEEFLEVCAWCLPEFDREITYGLGRVLIREKMRDVRELILLSRVIRPNWSHDRIERAVATHIKYSTTKTKAVNWNKKKRA